MLWEEQVLGEERSTVVLWEETVLREGLSSAGGREEECHGKVEKCRVSREGGGVGDVGMFVPRATEKNSSYHSS
jgi:hypothetical protein